MMNDPADISIRSALMIISDAALAAIPPMTTVTIPGCEARATRIASPSNGSPPPELTLTVTSSGNCARASLTMRAEKHPEPMNSHQS